MRKEKGTTWRDLVKQRRREAYERAKEERKSDPRLLARKQALKAKRREAYQAMKERLRAAVAQRQQERKERRSDRRARRQSEIDAALMKTLCSGSELADKERTSGGNRHTPDA